MAEQAGSRLAHSPTRWNVLWKYSTFEAGDSSWSLIIVSTYFGAYFQVVLGQAGRDFGWAVTAGALIVAVLSPLLGAAADHSGRRQPYLRVFVLGVVLATACLSWVTTVPAAIALFILAYICVNAAFTFFTAMIPAVSDERSVAGIVSATVGIGYVGSLSCLLALAPLVPTDKFAGRVFLPMALIYLVLAFPAMYLAPDFAARSGAKMDFRAAYGRLRQTVGEARRYRHAWYFLVGDFLYENAVASVITLMGLYSRNVMGFKSSELTLVFGPAIVVAIIAALFVFGPLIRLIGPKRAVLLDLAVWLILFTLVLAIKPGATLHAGSIHLEAKQLFVLVVAPLAGIGLAGVWSSSRVLLTALTPVDKSGEFWGLYNLSGRTASVVGDATWSSIMTVLGEQLLGYQMAVGALALYVLAGAGLIALVPDVRPSSANFVRATSAAP